MTDNKRFNSPQCRVIDSHSGAPVKKKELMNPAYWQQSFYVDSSTGQEKVISELTAQGYGVFLIFGQDSGSIPHPEGQRRIFQIQNSWEQLVQSLVHLYCSGVHIQWTAFYSGHQPEKILLPTYPFERKPYWSPFLPTVQSAVKETAVYPCESASNPLEGRRIYSPLNKNRFEYCYHMSLENFPELNDTHGVFHVGYCQEILSRAIKQSFPDIPSYVVKETDFISALMLSEEHTTTVHLILAPDKGSEIIFFEFYSRSQDSDQWDLNIKGTIELKRKYERFNQSPEFFEEI
jgi:acyl transferase domain-containing protein